MLFIKIRITRNTLQLFEMRTPHYSIKQTDFVVPLVPGLYKIHLIMLRLAGLSYKDCLAPLIDSPTGHYTNIGTHSSSLWLSFLAIVQQVRALEHAFIALNGTSMHCHAYRKYTESHRSRDISLLRTLLNGTNGVHIMEVPL